MKKAITKHKLICCFHRLESIEIALFYSPNRKGAYSRDKNICAVTFAENRRGGLYSRGVWRVYDCTSLLSSGQILYKTCVRPSVCNGRSAETI